MFIKARASSRYVNNINLNFASHLASRLDILLTCEKLNIYF